jgi:hypothetical protein
MTSPTKATAPLPPFPSIIVESTADYEATCRVISRTRAVLVFSEEPESRLHTMGRIYLAWRGGHYRPVFQTAILLGGHRCDGVELQGLVDRLLVDAEAAVRARPSIRTLDAELARVAAAQALWSSRLHAAQSPIDPHRVWLAQAEQARAALRDHVSRDRELLRLLDEQTARQGRFVCPVESPELDRLRLWLTGPHTAEARVEWPGVSFRGRHFEVRHWFYQGRGRWVAGEGSAREIHPGSPDVPDQPDLIEPFMAAIADAGLAYLDAHPELSWQYRHWRILRREVFHLDRIALYEGQIAKLQPRVTALARQLETLNRRAERRDDDRGRLQRTRRGYCARPVSGPPRPILRTPSWH